MSAIDGAAMFAPRVARTQTKTPPSSASNLAHHRSALVPLRLSGGAVEPADVSRWSIDNEATPEFPAPWARWSPGDERSNPPLEVTDGVALEAPGVRCDFSKISIFAPDRADRPEAGSRPAAPSLPGVIQPKLSVGPVNDPFEHEADRVADQVMRMPDPEVSVSTAPPLVSRKCGDCDEEELQKKPMGPEGATEQATGIVYELLRSPGQPFEAATREFFESRFDHDFSHVRVHTGPSAEQSARALNANAYTAGHHVVFGAGRFAPGTQEGRRLIAHELTHVLQQSGAEGPASPRIVQRQRANYHAGGCATCRSASAAGSVAHPFAQRLFIEAYGSGIVAEAPVNNPNDDNGRLDLFRVNRFGRPPRIVEYGEIKPDNADGLKQGRKDLEWYGEQLSRIFEPPDWLVSRLDVAAPPGVMLFKDNMRLACPWQELSVRGTKIGAHEPGLYLYKCDPPGRPARTSTAPCCEGEDEDPEHPPQPPVLVEPLEETKGDTKSPSESKGEREGQRDKGNGQRRPGRPSRPQPTLRPPSGVDWAKVVVILTAILALLALTPWGRIGAWLGTALGALLRWLFSLGIVAEGAAASAAGSSGDPGGPPAGEAVPSGRRIAPPASTFPPPVGTTVPPATQTPPLSGPRAAEPVPSGPTIALPASTSRPPVGTAVPPAKQTPPAKGTPQPRPQTIKVSVIEGMNLETFSVGRFSLVLLDPGGPAEVLVTLQATKKVVNGKTTTVTFKSVGECRRRNEPHCTSGGNVYIVTTPYHPSGEPAVAGYVTPLSGFFPPAWNLDAIADALDAAGRKAEGSRVRQEARQLKQVAEGGNL